MQPENVILIFSRAMRQPCERLARLLDPRYRVTRLEVKAAESFQRVSRDPAERTARVHIPSSTADEAAARIEQFAQGRPPEERALVRRLAGHRRKGRWLPSGTWLEYYVAYRVREVA